MTIAMTYMTAQRGQFLHNKMLKQEITINVVTIGFAMPAVGCCKPADIKFATANGGVAQWQLICTCMCRHVH